VLHNTAGVTFQAAEGGEEDIRLRGFSLTTTGDIFVDGVRAPAFYERDTFNNDRIELLRGSAPLVVRPWFHRWCGEPSQQATPLHGRERNQRHPGQLPLPPDYR
jgi:hypothetical protein